MDKIRVDAGVKKILINDGPEFIEFNPGDIGFAERFYGLVKDFDSRRVKYLERSTEIEANKELDDSGLPANVPEGLQLVREVCERMREQIDVVFGGGTSQKVFGDALSPDMFEQFFAGITPFIETARNKKIAKYIKPNAKSKKRVAMK